MQSMYIRVHATPDAKKERVTAIGPERYDIYVQEPAERNLANLRIKKLLAQEYNVPVNKVRQISGHRSAHKIFSVDAL